MSLKLYLEDLGFSVVGQLKETDNLRHEVEQFTPDLIMLDILLKNDVNGLNLAEEFRRGGGEKPILFISALSDKKTLETIGNIENSSYVVKPYDYSILDNQIQQLLS